MVSRRTLILGCAMLFLAVLAAGCSASGDNMEIKGTVKLEGQPLDQGSIRFVSSDGRTVSGGEIKNGAYELPKKNGLLPGKYLVQITSGDGKTPASDEEIAAPGGTNIVSVDRIPPEWNINSKKEVEVTKGGKNTFDFDIPTANKPKKR